MSLLTQKQLIPVKYIFQNIIFITQQEKADGELFLIHLTKKLIEIGADQEELARLITNQGIEVLLVGSREIGDMMIKAGKIEIMMEAEGIGLLKEKEGGKADGRSQMLILERRMMPIELTLVKTCIQKIVMLNINQRLLQLIKPCLLILSLLWTVDTKFSLIRMQQIVKGHMRSKAVKIY